MWLRHNVHPFSRCVALCHAEIHYCMHAYASTIMHEADLVVWCGNCGHSMLCEKHRSSEPSSIGPQQTKRIAEQADS